MCPAPPTSPAGPLQSPPLPRLNKLLIRSSDILGQGTVTVEIAVLLHERRDGSVKFFVSGSDLFFQMVAFLSVLLGFQQRPDRLVDVDEPDAVRPGMIAVAPAQPPSLVAQHKPMILWIFIDRPIDDERC